MPVSPTTAYALLHAFGFVEFTLKRVPGFTGRDGRHNTAKANWSAVERAADALPEEAFVQAISLAARDKLLGGARDRPMVQMVEVVEGRNIARFEPRNLANTDAIALIEATRRVRNNLIHGGKEDPLEEQYPGDDEDWAAAALEVVTLLQELLDLQQLTPLEEQPR